MAKHHENLWTLIQHVAGHIGILPNTVTQWQLRGYVPPSKHYDLVMMAKALGVSAITHESLHLQYKKAKGRKK